MTAAWKDLERRVCRALGGERNGPTGRGCSDCSDAVPFSVEVKRSQRLGPPILAKWILQARKHSAAENLPWLVVVAGHHDRHPVACLDFWQLVDLLQEAGRLPTPLEIHDLRDKGPRASMQPRGHTAKEHHLVTPATPEPEPGTAESDPDDTDSDDDV